MTWRMRSRRKGIWRGNVVSERGKVEKGEVG
jgi:hypothetical protein